MLVAGDKRFVVRFAVVNPAGEADSKHGKIGPGFVPVVEPMRPGFGFVVQVGKCGGFPAAVVVGAGRIFGQFAVTVGAGQGVVVSSPNHSSS